MKNVFKFLLLSLCGFTFHSSPAMSAPKANSSVSEAIAKTIDDWHLAASKPDEKAYFGAMTENMVFLGTDPGERWTKEQFLAYSRPIFAKGKGWEMKSVKRNIFLSGDGKTAWFDEDVESKGLGPVRGSGVLVKDKAGWKIAQYNLSVPIPNDKFDAARKLFDKKD